MLQLRQEVPGGTKGQQGGTKGVRGMKGQAELDADCCFLCCCCSCWMLFHCCAGDVGVSWRSLFHLTRLRPELRGPSG